MSIRGIDLLLEEGMNVKSVIATGRRPRLFIKQNASEFYTV